MGIKEVCSPITRPTRLPASELSPGALSNPDNPRRRGDQGAVPASSLPSSGTGSTPTSATHSIPPLIVPLVIPPAGPYGAADWRGRPKCPLSDTNSCL
jgi:hypothetical protein